MLAIFVIIIILFTAARTSALRPHLSVPERWARNILEPIQSGADIVLGKFAILPDYFKGVDSLRRENDELLSEVRLLQEQLGTLQEDKAENERLLELLAMQRSLSDEWQTMATTVIGRSVNDWLSTITIQGGSEDGLAVGMPVVADRGLVGRIVNVNLYSSEVLLITDMEGAVGAMLQDTRAVGVIKGSGGRNEKLSMSYLPYDSGIERFQTVVSSGLGGLYPKGLRIGYVTDFITEPGGLLLRATIQPFVDFNRLEEVLVLTGRVSPTGQPTQGAGEGQ